MSSALLRILLAVVFLSSTLQKSDGEEVYYWCIADDQFPDEVLQRALDWACGNGADCSEITENEACYLPNTVKDHASFAFNSYYQKMKHYGASCNFNAAAIISQRDPSCGSCKFEFLP